ncbi:MAG: class I SAM-dependent methyltransferase, partial [Dehalococcoidia bacterium]
MSKEQDAPTPDSNLFRQEYTEKIVDSWDDYIDWDRRKDTEHGFFQRLLKEHGAHKVLDAACGTGYHTVILAQDGFDVTASDGSANMVAKARENAENAGLTRIPFHTVGWDRLPSVFPENSFDAIICLGNSFTHLFDEESRLKSLHAMYSLLKEGGVAVVDQRNYDSLLDQGENDDDHSTYYLGKSVNVEKVDVSEESLRFKFEHDDGSEGHLTTCPIRQEYLTGLLEQTGFRKVERYGDFKAEYNFYEPEFIIQVAR